MHVPAVVPEVLQGSIRYITNMPFDWYPFGESMQPDPPHRSGAGACTVDLHQLPSPNTLLVLAPKTLTDLTELGNCMEGYLSGCQRFADPEITNNDQ